MPPPPNVMSSCVSSKSLSQMQSSNAMLQQMKSRDSGSSAAEQGHFPRQHFANDVSLGAYLLQALCCRCENCGSTNTPQWRKGWYSEVLEKHVLLCNACGLKYSKNQFCPYCYFVYSRSSKSKHDDREAGSQWLSCQHCQRWVHIQCERTYGSTKLGKDKASYVCPHCISLIQQAQSQGKPIVDEQGKSIMFQPVPESNSTDDDDEHMEDAEVFSLHPQSRSREAPPTFGASPMDISDRQLGNSLHPSSASI